MKQTVLKFLGCYVTLVNHAPKHNICQLSFKLTEHAHLDLNSSAGIVNNEAEDNSKNGRCYA